MIWRFQRYHIQKFKRAVLCAALFLWPTLSAAAEITVTSANGNLTLTGRFIGYDGTYLQMESPYGPLTVRYGDMTCTGDDCPDPDSFVPTIRLSGASRMAEILLPGLIEGFGRSMGYRVAFAQIDSTHATLSLFQDDDHVADFTIRSSTTDEGFADLIAHEADLVMSVREVRESEVAVADGLGIGRLDDGRQSRIVALDGLVPIVAPGRNVPGISLRDLSRVYTGGIRDWTEVGGAPGRITVNLMDPSSGLAQGFLDSVVARMNRPLTEDVRYHATLADLVAAVAEDPNALGIVPWGKAVFAQQLALTDQCGFSLLPRAETLKAEDYPLTMPLFLYLPQRRQAPILREFLTWLRTPESQLVVRRSGFVDPGPVPIPLADQGQRFATAITLAGDEIPLEELQRMVAIMKPRTRLSTTFRFEAGSSRLDAQSRSGLLDLAQSLRKGRYEGRSIMLIGFSDGRGDANANRLLSEERAESVKRALVTLIGDVRDTVTIDTEAFGEALPMGCDDTSWGRELNRRVELWVD